MTLTQNAILKYWAEDSTNVKSLTQSDIGNGIVLQSDIYSNEVNAAEQYVWQAVQYLQHTGGLYSALIPYTNPDVVSLVTYNSGIYGISQYLRTTSNPGTTTNNPPLNGSTITVTNGISVYSGGTVNTDWQLLNDNMKTAIYDPNGIGKNLFPLTGSGAPASTPLYVGQEYYDQTNDLIYIANGTSSSANWILNNPGLKIGYSATTGHGNFPIAASDMHATRFICSQNCTITKLLIWSYSFASGKLYRMGIYDDNGAGDNSLPTTLLAETAEYTSTTISAGNLRGLLGTLTSPLKLVSGNTYWMAFHSNYAVTMEKASTSISNSVYRSIAYNSSGLPASFGTPTGNTATIVIGAW